MDVVDAFQLVLELAKQNIIDEHDNPEEHKRQTEACELVEDYIVNQLGDD